MMPTEVLSEHQVDYKHKYKALKRKLKFLVYEQECFMEELRKSQRKLLKISRDRSFLLDRLLQHEKIDDSSGDSDATATSDSEGEGHGSPAKKKRSSLSPGGLSMLGDASMAGLSGYSGLLQAQASLLHSTQDGSRKRPKASNKRAKTSTPKQSQSKVGSVHSEESNMPGQMTREQLERHLETRHFIGIEKAPAKLPMEIFSNENSNPESEPVTGDEEDTDLVIDMPQ
ncbi:INO80 complex subunit E-like [Liolophura sinensis]|uniref:INO80 complex subunit E-like n=1 Tax=Liolophura sinensis TaxID=3198878 RepID=UPI0031584EF3